MFSYYTGSLAGISRKILTVIIGSYTLELELRGGGIFANVETIVVADSQTHQDL